ncbi:MAG TPA: ABC transporter ATP-binding protein [Rhodopila sp.]|jgi:peptide/nickel transport system ATP-binding protein|nr:ABC transporter ATP-binding protein [Rhodopila sp.]
MTALIDLQNVSKTFAGGKVALENLSLTIEAEQPRFIAVVGESGSGKTTLARLLLGMIQPTHGAVRYEGDDLNRLSGSRKHAFRRDVQAIFQDPYEVYNPFYRVDHVLTTPVRKFRLGASNAERRELIETALRSVGLRPEEILGRYPHQLSGGQRQRIMVARALLLRPRLIVADEPVSMVDASLRATILGSLRKLHEDMRISILYITHDLATAYQVADSIIVLYRAAVVEAGDVENVVKAPRHPYTQLLINSIPRVSTERDWAAEKPPAPRAVASTGCRFADRCPSAFDRCLSESPPLFHPSADHAVACFLHDQRAQGYSGSATGGQR